MDKENQYDVIAEAIHLLHNDLHVRGWLSSQPHKWDEHKQRVPLDTLQERNKLTQYLWVLSDAHSGIRLTRRYEVAREVIALHKQQQRHIEARMAHRNESESR